MEADEDGNLKNGQQDIEEISDQSLYRIGRPMQLSLDELTKNEIKLVCHRRKRMARLTGIRSESFEAIENRPCFVKSKIFAWPAAHLKCSYRRKKEREMRDEEFKKREITTIPEEVFHYKRHSKSISAFKEKKNYQEKVASITLAVSRLRTMCLAKPEVLQDTVPEEVMKLFSKIEIQ